MKRLILIVLGAVLAGAVPVILWAYSGNSAVNGLTPAGYSGAPSWGTIPSGSSCLSAPTPCEQNCSSCHSGEGNGSGGNVTVFFNCQVTAASPCVAGGPFYTPGQAQTISVLIQDLSKTYWGFQLTARNASDGSNAGVLTPGSEGFTDVVCDSAADLGLAPTSRKNQVFSTTPCPSTAPIQWIDQSYLGYLSTNAPRSGQYSFTWTPSSSASGPIDIYVASVASDGQENDNVYNAQYTLTVPVSTQPTISSVSNGASFAPSTSAQPAVAPGSYIAIKGTNLANSTRQWATSDFKGNNLPTALDGVSLTINGVAAYVEYVSPTQINAVVPGTLAAGTNYTVELNNNSLLSYPGSVSVQNYAPAFFEWIVSGFTNAYAVAQRYPDYTDVGPPGLFSGITTTPVKGGDTVILYASGLGVTSPAVANGQLTPRFGPAAAVVHLPTVTIGGVGATVLNAALTPSYAGLYQIAITVPAGLSNGDQKITINTGQYTSTPVNPVYLTIQN